MDIAGLLDLVRAKKPLVYHITNWVTICDCANVVKAFGASPVMAHAIEEAADMAALADALVLNIGTLTKDVIQAMRLAARAANAKRIPVVLDVCGAGATRFRDDTCLSLLDDVSIAIVKGNISEVSRIAGLDVQTKGVDAVDVMAGEAEKSKWRRPWPGSGISPSLSREGETSLLVASRSS